MPHRALEFRRGPGRQRLNIQGNGVGGDLNFRGAGCGEEKGTPTHRRVDIKLLPDCGKVKLPRLGKHRPGMELETLASPRTDLLAPVPRLRRKVLHIPKGCGFHPPASPRSHHHAIVHLEDLPHKGGPRFRLRFGLHRTRRHRGRGARRWLVLEETLGERKGGRGRLLPGRSCSHRIQHQRGHRFFSFVRLDVESGDLDPPTLIHLDRIAEDGGGAGLEIDHGETGCPARLAEDLESADLGKPHVSLRLAVREHQFQLGHAVGSHRARAVPLDRLGTRGRQQAGHEQNNGQCPEIFHHHGFPREEG